MRKLVKMSCKLTNVYLCIYILIKGHGMDVVLLFMKLLFWVTGRTLCRLESVAVYEMGVE